MSEDNAEIMSDPTIALTAEIVSAYVANNPVPQSSVPSLIGEVYAALVGLGQPAQPAVAAVEKPSVSEIRRSIKPDGLVSFIDGKSYKSLKRHLTAHGHNPDSYRHTFGLPADYPMIAQAYREQRSAIAKTIGLGVPGSRKGAANTLPA